MGAEAQLKSQFAEGITSVRLQCDSSEAKHAVPTAKAAQLRQTPPHFRSTNEYVSDWLAPQSRGEGGIPAKIVMRLFYLFITDEQIQILAAPGTPPLTAAAQKRARGPHEHPRQMHTYRTRHLEILREDRLFLRNEIKNSNPDVLEIFKLFPRQSRKHPSTQKCSTCRPASASMCSKSRTDSKINNWPASRKPSPRKSPSPTQNAPTAANPLKARSKRHSSRP